ncbi:5,6-dimethylbenzimidazole synthase [Microlunatus endophyticus]|uniref:5,6-dimethylbenzimidazole synthase n=1 Tax=Microlunatus endophyticus TaxID=1716077 RepID=A0A917S647_9ACTN|nr:5,6-dimethylbenzimidazole synthase [Microlunatus endophyticus]GGL59823.1 5,6-dimethylbenzimidazole synthase [Microlunatus endophyticus]
MSVAEASLAGLYDVIARRRDVRAEFTGQPIADDQLLRILGAAHQAPSVGHSQPWDFILVRDHGTRQRFQQHVAAERDLYASELSGERSDTFAKIKIEGILESSLGIVVTYDAARGGPAVLGRHAIADAGLYSTCLAIQNLWLAAIGEGLGVGWVSFYREPFLRRLLDIPEEIRPIAWLCVGTISRLQDAPDLERHRWRDRRPLAEALHYETFRNGAITTDPEVADDQIDRSLRARDLRRCGDEPRDARGETVRNAQH